MKRLLKQNKTFLKIAKLLKGEGNKLFLLDYPADFTPRYTDNPHKLLQKIIAGNTSEYKRLLKSFTVYFDKVKQFQIYDTPNLVEPCWINGFLPGLDTLTLYSMIASQNPETYLEIGSGYSTRVVKKAIADNGLKTNIISIDPQPRAQLKKIGGKFIRQRLEDTDLNIFKKLKSGDILYLDGTHRALMNSDVTVFFLEVLPTLPKGVYVHIHDIYLPFDYPTITSESLYSEQYMLAQYLLYNQKHYEIILPNFWISRNTKFAKMTKSLWNNLPKEVEYHGGGFWFKIK